MASHVIDVPDFPKDGIVFKDLSPLFADGARSASHRRDRRRTTPDWFDVVAGIEARGFLLAAAVAYATGTGVVPVRKAGKLPRATHAASYDLEYGSATLEVHADAFVAGPAGAGGRRRAGHRRHRRGHPGSGRAGRRHGGRIRGRCWSSASSTAAADCPAAPVHALLTV